ncbi:MAG: hypothetical protein K5888_03470 [Lachnospiraceae bacterium]|nr:hypothetical protein [Lachnospiraceae bacterium]
MNMQVTKGQRDLLIGLLGILIAVAVWFLVASPTMEKTQKLEAENNTLKPKVEEYELRDARLDEYKLGIVQNNAEVETITARFPSAVELEDSVMFWANIDTAYPFKLRFKDLKLAERDPVLVAGAEDIDDASVIYEEDGSATISDETAENLSAKYKLYGAPMGMNFICNYEGMKDMFDYIVNQYNRNAINNFEIAYDDETGLLTGEIGIELFYIEGLDKEYTPPRIPSVPKGQSDVFHSLELDLDEAAALLLGENPGEVNSEENSEDSQE